ncbi:hypothetical protein ABNG03_03850 [Halorubrum sp. RMP-47]|uniref:Uncharacterized protein n=1 Tax=Halorubrum miltondacostae TaxID=3076378 RepID=A0ABD5M0P5_9EURY
MGPAQCGVEPCRESLYRGLDAKARVGDHLAGGRLRVIRCDHSTVCGHRLRGGRVSVVDEDAARRHLLGVRERIRLCFEQLAFGASSWNNIPERYLS